MKKANLRKSIPLLALLTPLIGVFHPSFADVELTQNGIMASGSGDTTTITITGPNNFVHQDTTTGNGSSINLGGAAILSDGLYVYEVKSFSYGGEQSVTDAANGRDNATRRTVTSVEVNTGTYTVVNGLIVVDDGTPEN